MVVQLTIRILLSAAGLSALAIIGWGIGDSNLFFASLPRTAFLLAMLIATAGAAASAKNPTKKGTLTPPGQRLLLASVQAVTLPLLVFLPYADRRGILVMHAEWVRWLGLGTALAGYAIMLFALRTLGKNYSAYVTIQEQHELVQTGIYSVCSRNYMLGQDARSRLDDCGCLTWASWPGHTRNLEILLLVRTRVLAKHL